MLSRAPCLQEADGAVSFAYAQSSQTQPSVPGTEEWLLEQLVGLQAGIPWGPVTLISRK